MGGSRVGYPPTRDDEPRDPQRRREGHPWPLTATAPTGRPSSATDCRPSCSTSTRTRPPSGASRSTPSSTTPGRNRARYLMLSLLQRAREKQVGVPSLRSTDYINTIPPEREPWFPGDEHVERRIRAYIRWNAAIMVHRAQRPGVEVGGHISTYASSRQPLRGRLQPLLPRQGPPRRRRPDLLPGPRLARHVRPRVPRGPADRGPARRLPPGALARGRRPVVLPAPAADAGLLGVPDRLDGPRPAQRDLPGAVQPLPARPRHQGHQPAARLGVPRRRRDGRARVARRHRAGGARGARQPHLRHQLQPAAPRRPGARQRQDHPGARVVLPRRRLERHQGDLGPRLGRAARRATPTARWST